VTSYDSIHREVAVIDTATRTVVDHIVVGSDSKGVAITPDGAFAYVANSGVDKSVSVIDTSTNSVVATIPNLGTEPWNVAITPDGAFAYVTIKGTNNVAVIETASNSVVGYVPVGGCPFGITITPNGQFAYVSNECENSESVINVATNTVVGTVPVALHPFGSAISPSGGFDYVPNNSEGTVSVINTATNTVAATIPVGFGAGEVAITPPIVGPETQLAPPLNTPLITPHPITTVPTKRTLAPRPKPISPAAAFSLPSTKHCSRRHFTIHVRKLPGIKWVRASIKINHRRIKTLGRSRITAAVSLVGLPKGVFVLSITATASDGRSVTGIRTYHTCVRKSKRRYASPKL
jgi:YVTN family beta-propeller protein